MLLKPLEIRFSQDSIGSKFGRCTSHPFIPIGETLDDILSGRCNFNSIPNISVVERNGLWFTSDNRRLWVFQEAEKRGKCSEIYVRETSYINYSKFTTTNNGTSIYVRGNPGGFLWRRMPEVIRKPIESPRKLFNIYQESSMRTSSNINTGISPRRVDTSLFSESYTYRQQNSVSTGLAYKSPKVEDSSETSSETSDCEQNYTVEAIDTETTYPKPQVDNLSEKSSDNVQSYSVDVRKRTVEEMEDCYNECSISLSTLDGTMRNNHERKSSSACPSHSICFENQYSGTFPNHFYATSIADDEINESVATSEEISGTFVEMKTVEEDKTISEDIIVMEGNKNMADIEKEEPIEDKYETVLIRSRISSLEERRESFEKTISVIEDRAVSEDKVNMKHSKNINHYDIVKESINNINKETESQKIFTISCSGEVNHGKESVIVNMGNVSKFPTNKNMSTKKIICISFIIIALVIAIFLIAYFLP